MKMMLKIQWLLTKLKLLMQWLIISLKVRFQYWFVDRDEWLYEGELDRANKIMKEFREGLH